VKIPTETGSVLVRNEEEFLSEVDQTKYQSSVGNCCIWWDGHVQSFTMLSWTVKNYDKLNLRRTHQGIEKSNVVLFWYKTERIGIGTTPKLGRAHW